MPLYTSLIRHPTIERYFKSPQDDLLSWLWPQDEWPELYIFSLKFSLCALHKYFWIMLPGKRGKQGFFVSDLGQWPKGVEKFRPNQYPLGQYPFARFHKIARFWRY